MVKSRYFNSDYKCKNELFCQKKDTFFIQNTSVFRGPGPAPVSDFGPGPGGAMAPVSNYTYFLLQYLIKYNQNENFIIFYTNFAHESMSLAVNLVLLT